MLKDPPKFVPLGATVAKSYKKTRTEIAEMNLNWTKRGVIYSCHNICFNSCNNQLRHVFDYGKASRLVDEVKNNSTLPLPRNYRRLHESFQSCDRVGDYFGVQRCLVDEIQMNVEKNTKITFSRKHLAQIIHVYPSSYDIKVEKKWKSKSRGKFELVMAANLINDLTGYMLPDTASKTDNQPLPKVTPVKLFSPRKKVVTAVPREPIVDSRPRLEGWRMTCRSHVFKHKLVEIVKKFHQKFLELLLNESELSRLRRFHPKFDLDHECEEIVEVGNFVQSFFFGMLVTFIVLDSFLLQTAIEDLKSPSKKLVSSCSATPLSPRKFAEQQSLKPKGAMSLLERVSRICSYGSLFMYVCLYFVLDPSKGSSLILEHISALCETAPEYFTITEIGGKRYLQLKQNNYVAIEKLLQEEVARLRGTGSSLPTANMLAVFGTVAMSPTKKSAVRALF
uniref:CDT1 domain-containing protein n=1 Tax=Angiostrongylus cantonensis TaxID=6313 RepID=A0A0K0DA90_ANGCA